MIKVISNHHRRQLLNWYEVDDPTSQADFQYVGDDVFSPRFVKYKGCWYDIGEFQDVQSVKPGFLSGWDGYTADTFFSGVLVKFLDGDDIGFVTMGRYYT